MSPLTNPLIRNPLAAAGLFALGFAPCFASPVLPAANAADSAAYVALDDKAPALPLACTFEKVEGENGPYVLHLKNTSNDAVKVSVQVTASVTFHANSKVRNVPEHAIEPGQDWTVTELAAADKVVVSAKGYAPLELTVP